MQNEYINAVETRLRWLRDMEDYRRWSRWFHDNAETSGMATTWRFYRDVLLTGDTYFMNKNFCRMVDMARKDVPDDMEFESSWPLSRCGFLWLEEPAELPSQIEMQGKPVPNTIKLDAIGWQFLDHNDGCRGVMNFACFAKMPSGLFCPWSYGTLLQGEKVLDRVHELERSFFGNPSSDQSCYVPGRETDIKHELRWIYTAFYMMADKISHHSRIEPNRALRRRLETMSPPVKPPTIQVVSLRRMEADRPKPQPGETEPVDWHWQWIVEGHWRNQYYPSTGTWKVKRIHSYVKGPEDKPLKPHPMKIFVARR